MLGSRQPFSDIPVDCYPGVIDDSLHPAGESAGPLCKTDVGLFPLSLEGEADRFAVFGVTFTALPEDVSVLAIELENGGDRYWQRPVGSSALFVVPGRLNISFTVTTLDSTGGIVATEKHVLSP